MIKIRKANLNDALYFSKLVLISSDYFNYLFGEKIDKILQNIFIKNSNLFSFENTYIAEYNNNIAGMILSYDFETKQKQNLQTGILLFKNNYINFIKNLNIFLKLNKTVGKLNPNEYYISNIAVYPEYRGNGIGKILLEFIEENAIKTNSKKIILDVEAENKIAINLYDKLNYKIIEKFTIALNKNKTLNFFRMGKSLYKE